MALTIYGMPASRAIRNLWMAKELGLEYRHVALPFGPEGTKSAEYLALNPHGQVPAIEDDGLVLTESLGINLYLAKKHGGPLGPRDLAEDAQMTSWALWSSIADAQFYTLLRTNLDLPEPERAAAAAPVKAAIAPKIAVLEAHLAKHGFLVGGRFTVADLNLAGCLFYLRLNPEVLADAPAVRAWHAAAMARPAAVSAWALRG